MPDDKGPVAKIFCLLTVVFAAGCLLMALFMPWAELGLPATPPGPLQALAGLYGGGQGLIQAMVRAAQTDKNFPFYVYSSFLGLAMIAGAIALNFVGREETEKTVLPTKK